MLRDEGVQRQCERFSGSTDAPVAKNASATFWRIDGGMFCCNVHRGVVGERRRVLASPTHSCATQVLPSMWPLATGRSACCLLPRQHRFAARPTSCAVSLRAI
jgi:hypothetical protein